MSTSHDKDHDAKTETKTEHAKPPAHEKAADKKPSGDEPLGLQRGGGGSPTSN